LRETPKTRQASATLPTIGCRQYADRLGDQGFSIAKSTVQKHLVAHGMGKRAQRLAKAAAIAAVTTGLVVPDAARKDEPFGFCLASGGPGELVCKLKGVGKVYQLTAIDVFTRFAVVSIVLGSVTGDMSARFIHQVLRLYRRHEVRVRAILTDNGPEYVAGAFAEALAAKGSPPSASSELEPTPGSSPTTTAGATTATTCAAVPLTRSSTTTRKTRQHDHHQPQGPSVT
jgi:hypothetical protein